MDKKVENKDSEAKSGASGEVNESRPLNILIIEDDKFAVKIIEHVLKNSNKECHVSVAKHGSAALDLVENNQFDIALIDIWLPDMNGLDVLARIKEINPHTVCHVISSQTDNSYVDKARMLGAEQYILKPLKTDQLLGITDLAVSP